MRMQITIRIRTTAAVAALTILSTLTAASVTYAELPPLIPREVLFPKPAAMQALRLSPDGRWLSYLAADDAGTPQVWIRDLDGATSRQLTKTASPGVTSYLWADNSRILCYELRQGAGTRLMGLEVASGKERALIAIEGATFTGLTKSPVRPDELLVSVRLPNTQEYDVYRLDLIAGTLVLDTKNPGRVPGNQFFADKRLVVRAVQRTTADGGTETLVRDGPSAAWRTWLTADPTYYLAIEAFNEDGTALLLRSDLRADKARLIARTIENGNERIIAASNDLDVEKVLLHPRTGVVQAVSFLRDPRRWEAIDRSVGTDLRRIGQNYPGRQLNIASRDAAASSTTSNLIAFVNQFPKTPDNAWTLTTVGDPDNPKDAELLRSVSPFFHVDRVSKPFLIARGDKDGVLPPGDLDSFIEEVDKRGGNAVSIVYEGDGHFFRRENQLDYFGRVEALFARCLGGRAEPMTGEKQAGCTARAKTVGKW